MKSLIIILLLFLLPASLLAQQEISPDTITKRLLRQTIIYPQENIYTQTDKGDYVAGDTLWFRTYVVNAISRKPEKISQYAYTELIDIKADTVIYRVKARKDTCGMIYGYLPIPPTLSKGIYRLRTYTQYGTNWGEDGCYNKPIHIYSLQRRESPKAQDTPSNYQVDFLPEGGYAIDRQICRFAFKAQNSNGSGENINGAVVDEKGDTITQFASFHDGMGELSFVPVYGKKYYARCIDNYGRKKQFVLPQAVRNAATLKVTANAKYCIVSLLQDSLFCTNPLQLVVLQRGYPCLVKSLGETKNITIRKEDMDTGVTHFLLVDGKGKILSERLVFIDHTKDKICELNINKADFIPRQLVNVSFKLKDLSSSIPWEGNCSVSVTDTQDVPTRRANHILATLLLTADISGHIEDPEWYFDAPNHKEREKALDLLMMTHGWRKYDLQSAINGRYTSPTLLPETSMKLSGKVTNLFNKPIHKSNVQIFALGASVIKTLETNKEGKFELEGFELPDSVKYLITALSPQKRKSNIVLQMRKDKFPDITHIDYTTSHNPIKTATDENCQTKGEYIEKAFKSMGYSNGIRHYILEEVKVKAKARKEYLSEFEHDASITITEDRIKQSPGLESLELILSSIAGFYNISSATLVLDGVRQDSIGKNMLLRISPSNIGQIDILKGIQTVGYFSAKDPIIIAITTKKGGSQYNHKYMDSNMATWIPLGYQQPIEKYSPHYDSPLSDHPNKPDLRTTIYWKPNLQIKDGKASFSFFTADSPSTYQITVEGVSNNGRRFRKEETIFGAETTL